MNHLLAEIQAQIDVGNIIIGIISGLCFIVSTLVVGYISLITKFHKFQIEDINIKNDIKNIKNDIRQMRENLRTLNQCLYSNNINCKINDHGQDSSRNYL